MKIVYQGSPGAYSHLAAKKIYPNYEFIPYNTFEDCFKHCNENEEHKTIIPVENSIAGRVADIQYLINKYKLQIYAEHFQEIKHNLMILKDNKLENVNSVRSHSQAISQCQKYITSCIFKVKNKPAALYKCLGGFATNNVNLSKLESFSDQNSFEQYLFICDMYGHIEDPKIQKSLEELGFHTVNLDILGVYEASEYRNIK